MPNFKIRTLILFSSFIFITACNAKTEAPEDTSSAPDEPIMQAGGYSNINNAKLQELVDQGVLLVDIRREEEWKQTGIVKDSRTITFFDRAGNVSKDFVPQFTAVAKPNQAIMLICRTGNRTKAASEALVKQLGYKNVMNVTKGIMGWIAEKRPVIKY